MIDLIRQFLYDGTFARRSVRAFLLFVGAMLVADAGLLEDPSLARIGAAAIRALPLGAAGMVAAGEKNQPPK